MWFISFMLSLNRMCITSSTRYIRIILRCNSIPKLRKQHQSNDAIFNRSLMFSIVFSVISLFINCHHPDVLSTRKTSFQLLFEICRFTLQDRMFIASVNNGWSRILLITWGYFVSCNLIRAVASWFWKLRISVNSSLRDWFEPSEGCVRWKTDCSSF